MCFHPSVPGLGCGSPCLPAHCYPSALCPRCPLLGSHCCLLFKSATSCSAAMCAQWGCSCAWPPPVWLRAVQCGQQAGRWLCKAGDCAGGQPAPGVGAVQRLAGQVYSQTKGWNLQAVLAILTTARGRGGSGSGSGSGRCANARTAQLRRQSRLPTALCSALPRLLFLPPARAARTALQALRRAVQPHRLQGAAQGGLAAAAGLVKLQGRSGGWAAGRGCVCGGGSRVAH